MVYEHGFFHADPHAGNLLIRPTVQPSRSPFNFEIALLDHGALFVSRNPLALMPLGQVSTSISRTTSESTTLDFGCPCWLRQRAKQRLQGGTTPKC
jgi:hypothetical protein